MALSLNKSYNIRASDNQLDANAIDMDLNNLFDAINGLETQDLSLSGLTIQPLTDSGTVFLVNNAAGTEIFSIDTTNQDLALIATGKMFFDGGGNTYIHESGADNLELFVGGAIAFTGLAGNDCALEATGRLYFDGGTETYITESGSDVLDITVGGANLLKLTDDATDRIEAVNCDVWLDATFKLYLDGGGATYFFESSDNVIKLVVDGGDKMTWQATIVSSVTDFAVQTGDTLFLDGGSSTDAGISDGSQGSGSTALFIGNETIDTSPSDIRLKENIEDSTIDGMQIVNDFDVKDFDWKEGNPRKDRGRSTGMIAQTLWAKLKQVVRKPTKESNMWCIEYHLIVPYLIKALQEKDIEIQDLLARTTDLETRVTTLEGYH